MTGTQWSRRGGQHVGRNLNLVSFVGVVFVLVLSQGQLCFAQNNNQQQSSDLFRDTSWEQLQHASVSPGRRYGAATLSISSPKGLILFGGVDEAGVILGDTYQYFADQKQWVQLKSGSNSCCGKNCTSGVPCPRAYSSLHSMGTRALLFGGSCDLSSGASHELEHILESRATKVEPCEDTLWELDMLNNKWKRLYAEGYKGATSPPPRTAHGAISQSNSLYVYGGHTGSTWASDASQDERVVWEYRWDQNRWSRLEPQGEMLKSGQVLASTITFQIRKRYGHAAILHQYQSKNRILFHGGFQRDEATGDVHVTNDVLEWDITTKTWRKWELQYSPFRAFHTMHLYSPSSAFSQGTGYMVIAFGFGHDKPNTVTVGDVPSDEVDVVRGVDIHVFDDSSVTPQDFVTYDVLQGLKPTPRQGASGAFIGDGILITAGGYQDGATSGDAYWALHMRGQLYDQGTLSLPAEIGAKGVEEILVMSGEVEIGSWKSASPLPAQLDIPSGTDIIVLAFQNGTLMATEKLTIVPQETKTAQLVYLQEELVTVTCLREDSVSAFPDLDVVMDVFDVREKVWTTVASGKTDVEGKFRANVVPVRGVYTGALSSYAAKYETSYRFTATLSTENGSLQIVPNELLEVYPSSPVEKSYASALETLPARESIDLILPEKNTTTTRNATTTVTVVTQAEVTSLIVPLQYGYFGTMLYAMGPRQEFKLMVESQDTPIQLFASVASIHRFPTEGNKQWTGNCVERRAFSQGPHTCSLMFNSLGSDTELALGLITTETSSKSYAVKIRAEIIEMPEEIPPAPVLQVESKKQVSVDLDMIFIIVGSSVGFVLLLTASTKFLHRRKRKQAVMPKGGTAKKALDLEAGGDKSNGGKNAEGWDDVMARNKDSDIFEDFGELASEYQRWMAQGDAHSNIQENSKQEKLAALQKLSVKYEELEEDKKTLEGLPLAALNAKALETKNKYTANGKPAKKSKNGLMVPRAPAGILPPETNYPKPPIDSPVGYDLTPHKRGGSQDPRLGKKESSTSGRVFGATSPSKIESQFLAKIAEDGGIGAIDAEIEVGQNMPKRLDPLGSERNSVLPPRAPPGSGITPPLSPQTRPPPPPRPPPASAPPSNQLSDVLEGKDVFAAKSKSQGAPKNKLQKLKSKTKRKDPNKDKET